MQVWQRTLNMFIQLNYKFEYRQIQFKQLAKGFIYQNAAIQFQSLRNLYKSKQTNIPTMSFQLQIKEYNQKVQRNVKDKCEICKEDFSILRRQHICKRCCRSVCDDDSPFKVHSYRKDAQRRLHRMCRSCHIQSQVLNKYIQKNKLFWAKDSEYAKVWLKQYKNNKQSDQDFNKNQDQIYFSNDQQIVQMTQLWKSFNFSFRQYIGIVMDAMNPYDQKQIVKTINSGLLAIGRKKISQLSNSVYILLFFLTHLSLSNSIFMTLEVTKIINKTPPQIQNVLNYLEQFGCSEIELYKFQGFLDDVFYQLANKLTLNMFTAQMSIQIVTLIIVNENSQQLQKGIAFVLWQRRQFICQNASKAGLIFDDILKHISSSNYRKKIKDLKSKTLLSQNQTVKIKKMQYESVLEQNKALKKQLENKQKQISKLKMIQKQNQIETESTKIKNRQTQQSDHKQKDYQSQDNLQKQLIFSHKGKYQSKKKQKQKQKEERNLSIEQQQHWSALLQSKNDQISKLRQKLKEIQHNYKQVCETNEQKEQIQRQQKQQRENKIKDQQKQLETYKKQAENMKNMNNLLLMKMNELSELIMDKEEKILKQSQKQQGVQQQNDEKQSSFNKISIQLKQLQQKNENVQKECIIY